MSDSMEPRHDPRPRGKRVLAWALGVPVAVLALLLALHVLIRPIPPTQVAPRSHPGEPCWLCHMVLETATPVEVEAE